MLNKVSSFLYVLSIGAVINLLHGHTYHNSNYNNDISGAKMSKLLKLTIGMQNFLFKPRNAGQDTAVRR
ncbi:hypothetical protein DBV15_02716 [Temnothorax longispinosus]|uniref:Uncharacterized protein n=1 Tax=Temnothorax longispinosus TaxID=300112 RepID=A0A4S2KDT9_9HYME|nr:hypothetical protein DBV15_02716 [Temnothorax longispinosus]